MNSHSSLDQAEARLIFGGDTTPVGRGAMAAELGPAVFWPEIVSLFRSHDLAVVNLETPLAQKNTGPALKIGPVLVGDVRFADFLAASGVGVVTLANNHIMDAGLDGLKSTLRALDRAKVLRTGAGSTLATAEEPLVVQTPGGTVGIVSVAEGEFSAASAKCGGAAPLREAAIAVRLQQLESVCAMTVVVFHGGNEHHGLPSPEMVSRCRSLVDAGATLVVCHHSHVVSGVEEYHGGLIAYGLGNLMFDPPRAGAAEWDTGALLSVRVRSGRVVEWELLGAEQDMSVPTVRRVADNEAFERVLGSRSATIASASALAAEFERFCRSQREFYLTKMLGLSRLERHLLRRGLRPLWRLRSKSLLDLLNVLQCESHEEAAAEVLRQELRLAGKRRRDG
jgi:hypothetical protein